MSVSERDFEALPDQFHHLLVTKLGPIYVAFLLHLFRISVKDPITHLPTIELFKDQLEFDTERYRKRIVDSLFKLLSKAEEETEYILTVLQVEHQHRNEKDLNYRMFDYLHPIANHYKGYELTQILVYTGDEPFKSPNILKFRDTTYRFKVVDFTRDYLKEMLEFPHFGIQFLCIFNHQMPEQEKVNTIVEGFRAYYQQYGRAEAQIFIDLLPLAMTNHNIGAIDTITAILSKNPEFEEMIKQTAYYKKGEKKGKEEGREEGKAEGREEGKAEGREEGKAEGREEGKAEGKILSALAFIRKGKMTVAEVAETLELTAEEIAAIQTLLQQSSNGNGNGKHG